MMGKVFAQEAAGTVTANVESAEKVVFLGMTAPQLVAFGAGVAVGGVLCYAGYRLYKKKADAAETGNLFEKRRKLKSIRELVPKQEHIPALDSLNVREWFRDNHVEIEDVKLMIAIPSDKVLNAVGYVLDDDEIDLDKFIIQSIYNSKNGTVYKLRFVAFDSIESALQAKLLENNGLVILDA